MKKAIARLKTLLRTLHVPEAVEPSEVPPFTITTDLSEIRLLLAEFENTQDRRDLDAAEEALSKLHGDNRERRVQIEYFKACISFFETDYVQAALELNKLLKNLNGVSDGTAMVIKHLRLTAVNRVLDLEYDPTDEDTKMLLNAYRDYDLDHGAPISRYDGFLAPGAIAIFPREATLLAPNIDQCYLVVVKDPDTNLTAAAHYHGSNNVNSLDLLFDVFGKRNKAAPKFQVKLLGGDETEQGVINTLSIFDYFTNRNDAKIVAATFATADRDRSVLIVGGEATMRPGTTNKWPDNGLLKTETETLYVRNRPLYVQLNLTKSDELRPVFLDPQEVQALIEHSQSSQTGGTNYQMREAFARESLKREAESAVAHITDGTGLEASDVMDVCALTGLYIGDGSPKYNQPLIDTITSDGQDSAKCFRFEEHYIPSQARREEPPTTLKPTKQGPLPQFPELPLSQRRPTL